MEYLAKEPGEVIVVAEPEAAAVWVGCYSGHLKIHVTFPNISFLLRAVVGGCRPSKDCNVSFKLEKWPFHNYFLLSNY